MKTFDDVKQELLEAISSVIGLGSEVTIGYVQAYAQLCATQGAWPMYSAGIVAQTVKETVDG